MTSSVNGLEFFLGSLIPVIAMVTVVNAVLVPVVGFRMNGVQWAVYISVSLLAAVASGVIGMIFGIFAKESDHCRNTDDAGTAGPDDDPHVFRPECGAWENI